ncbi:unnamed protein product [Ectocarpus sp. 8 AP-2014]
MLAFFVTHICLVRTCWSSRWFSCYPVSVAWVGEIVRFWARWNSRVVVGIFVPSSNLPWALVSKLEGRNS